MHSVLAISPHLDDAALSAGARLAGVAATGGRSTVFTVFSAAIKGPYSETARRLHSLMRFQSVNIADERIAEDEAAHKILRAHAAHGGFLDSIYRRREDGSWLIGEDPTLTLEDSELMLKSQITARVREMVIRERPDLVLTCAGIGNHVDHILTRDSVLAALAGDQTTPLELWEDLPYALWAPGAPLPELRGALTWSHSVTYEHPAAMWELKYRALDCYRSQRSMLWESADPRHELGSYERVVGGGGDRRGERFWQLRSQACSPEEGCGQ